MHYARHATSCVIEMQVPEARACAVQANGQVAAVGGSAEMLLLQQQATTVTDLQGAFMMPVSLYESCASSTKVSISVYVQSAWTRHLYQQTDTLLLINLLH